MDGRHQVAWHVSPTDSDSISSNSRIYIISGRNCKSDPPTFDYICSAWIVRPWFPMDFPSSQVEICANFAQAMLSVLKVIQKFHGKIIIHRRGTKKSVKQIQKCRRITQNLTCRVFNIDLTYFSSKKSHVWIIWAFLGPKNPRPVHATSADFGSINIQWINIMDSIRCSYRLISFNPFGGYMT